MPQLHLVTDSRLGTEALLRAVRAAAENGVDWIQVRDRLATARDLFDLTQRVVAVCRPLDVRVAVNDRIDVALAVGADAVQLGTRSLPIGIAKRIIGPLLIGASVHTLAEGVNAVAEGAAWITFGHIFPSTSHQSEDHRDITELAELVEEVDVPVIAIGGIGVDQVARVVASGAKGVAVISAILEAPDPGQAVADLRSRLSRFADH